MEKRIQDELNILKDIIVETVSVEQIFLFGSYAGGTPHADSDLDLYVQNSGHDIALRVDLALPRTSEPPPLAETGDSVMPRVSARINGDIFLLYNDKWPS